MKKKAYTKKNKEKMKVTIGGNRLGSGKKMQADLHGYERSTHNLGNTVKTTMAAGTLVPFLKKIMLPGDTFDIDLQADVRTHPTIGPLFGSYKLQLDIFQAPIRLYQSALHNNKQGVGLNMEKIPLPGFIGARVRRTELDTQEDPDNYIVNPSCILHYLGYKGAGLKDTASGVGRVINAVPLLAYWDIYKNYYANQQEERGYVVDILPGFAGVTTMTVNNFAIQTTAGTPVAISPTTDGVKVTFDRTYTLGDESRIEIEVDKGGTKSWVKLTTLYLTKTYSGANAWFDDLNPLYDTGYSVVRYRLTSVPVPTVEKQPRISSFSLSNLDKIKEDILAKPPLERFLIDNDAAEQQPINAALRGQTSATMVNASSRNTQQGLGIKTYQNDIFNNWLNSEWLDNATTGINAITAVSTAGNSFTIDALNLSNKVFNMLNRVALSGGTYKDWIKVNWDYDFITNAESPIYEGGLSKEIMFEEIVSTAESMDGDFNQPLGTLAGKGKLGGKHKGGSIVVKAKEHSYLIGIVSITPRIAYSQGNDWDMGLLSLNDFHKPALDGIGFQDLLQEQQAWWASMQTGPAPIQPQFYATGKQPAWINYMTEVDKIHGNFAIKSNQMFMVLDRRYEQPTSWITPTISDNTTYVDPQKFNFIFADTSPSAQNFWVEIAVDIKARRKMSAKIMPNL